LNIFIGYLEEEEVLIFFSSDSVYPLFLSRDRRPEIEVPFLRTKRSSRRTRVVRSLPSEMVFFSPACDTGGVPSSSLPPGKSIPL